MARPWTWWRSLAGVLLAFAAVALLAAWLIHASTVEGPGAFGGCEGAFLRCFPEKLASLVLGAVGGSLLVAGALAAGWAAARRRREGPRVARVVIPPRGQS